MNMSMKEFYNSIYRLAFIPRYATRLRIRTEDVAQHSFFVSAIVLKLYEKYEFDIGLSIIAAISHDIPEADLGDIGVPVKRSSVDFAKEINKMEYKIIEKYPIRMQMGFKRFDDNESVSGRIAQLADAIQVAQYVESEIELGNRSMFDIKEEVTIRIKKLEKDLQDYERPIS